MGFNMEERKYVGSDGLAYFGCRLPKRLSVILTNEARRMTEQESRPVSRTEIIVEALIRYFADHGIDVGVVNKRMHDEV